MRRFFVYYGVGGLSYQCLQDLVELSEGTVFRGNTPINNVTVATVDNDWHNEWDGTREVEFSRLGTDEPVRRVAIHSVSILGSTSTRFQSSSALVGFDRQPGDLMQHRTAFGGARC
jgi:hypothetical protein